MGSPSRAGEGEVDTDVEAYDAGSPSWGDWALWVSVFGAQSCGLRGISSL